MPESMPAPQPEPASIHLSEFLYEFLPDFLFKTLVKFIPRPLPLSRPKFSVLVSSAIPEPAGPGPPQINLVGHSGSSTFGGGFCYGFSPHSVCMARSLRFYCELCIPKDIHRVQCYGECFQALLDYRPQHALCFSHTKVKLHSSVPCLNCLSMI